MVGREGLAGKNVRVIALATEGELDMIFPCLGIYGWKEADENLALSSLLTGDPVLLVGSHGTAKTGLFMKIAEALGLRAISYDASKALFEDVLGYPNPKELLEGRVRYIGSDVTIWDNEFVLVTFSGTSSTAPRRRCRTSGWRSSAAAGSWAPRPRSSGSGPP